QQVAVRRDLESTIGFAFAAVSLNLHRGAVPISGLPGPIHRDCRVMITAYYLSSGRFSYTTVVQSIKQQTRKGNPVNAKNITALASLQPISFHRRGRRVESCPLWAEDPPRTCIVPIGDRLKSCHRHLGVVR